MLRRDFLKRSLAGTALAAATGLSFKKIALNAEPVAPTQLSSSSSSSSSSFSSSLPSPSSPPPSNRYTRLFPHLAVAPKTNNTGTPTDEEQWLVRLGQNMKDAPDARPDPKHLPPMAGYTYLGQFINHDLSFDQTPLDQAHPDAARMINLRTPALDLDHVYGGGPNVSPFLYDRLSKHGEEKFLIGETASTVVDGKTFPSTPDDLPRNLQGTALVPDPRQDENLIIAQLHVVFLKLHNRIMSEPDWHKEDGVEPGGSPFERAQRIVRWHYQWVVRHDFLRQLLHPTVFAQLDALTAPAAPKVAAATEGGSPSPLPLEYVVAAGRFGHSMVRDNYFINDTHPDASLRDEIGRLTGLRGGACPRLPADWVVAWERFFFVGSGLFQTRRSQSINTRIAAGLFEPEHPGMPPLPVRTLLRGYRTGLPSGQEVAQAIGLDPLPPDAFASDPEDGSAHRTQNTPLWYYILREAELTGSGAHLGLLGSWLLAKVIMTALTSDPDSYLSVAPDWVPTLNLPVRLGPGRADEIRPGQADLFGMADLIRFALSAP